MRHLPILVIALLLAGCGPRGGITLYPAAAEVGTVESVLIASSRERVEGQPVYTRGRSETLSFSRFEVSVPPQRAVGTVTFPDSYPPDPLTDFVTVGAHALRDEDAFVAAIDQKLASDPDNDGTATVFVHGYNTNFAEGLYRHAQLQYDYDSHAATVHFAWPSAATATGYVYDQDSALFSRQSLERTLAAMSRSNATRFNVIAHSMGAFLTMDTLAIMARSGRYADFFDRVNAVLLLSPDIEVDVFRSQARPVLAEGVPIFVVVSTRDRALLISARIRGSVDRLGSIASKEELGDVEVTVIDLSNVEAGGGLGHFAIANSPELIGLLRGFREAGIDVLGSESQQGVIESSVSLIQQGTEFIFSPFIR
jgi:esterase/lipase superfamily enzyme